MHRTDSPREVRLAIPMLPDMEMTALQTAEAVLVHMHFQQEQIDEVKHALVEGCINAFEHSGSADGLLHLRFVMWPDELVVELTDFGGGFEPAAVPLPAIATKIHSDHKRGWGLMLMKSLMDSVEIESSDLGTRVTMTKRRPPQEAEPA